MTIPTEMKVRDPMKTDHNGHSTDKEKTTCCFGRLFKKKECSDLPVSPARDFDKDPIKAKDAELQKSPPLKYTDK